MASLTLPPGAGRRGPEQIRVPVCGRGVKDDHERVWNAENRGRASVFTHVDRLGYLSAGMKHEPTGGVLMTTEGIQAWLLAAAVVAGLSGQAAQGEGFRVDSRVYVADQKEPISESSTLFAEELVYDFLEKPPEILVYDRPHGMLTLLKADRRVSTRIALQDVISFTEQLRARAAAHTDPFVQFLANPHFEEHDGGTAGALRLSSAWLSYEVQGAASTNPIEVARFREFSDWYVQMSPIFDPAARPPFARMMLNDALQRAGLIPRKLTLIMTPKRGFFMKPVTLRSEHEVIDRLSGADRDRMVQAQQFMAIFNPVGLDQYRE